MYLVRITSWKMMMKVEFMILGEPFGKQRPQFSTFSGHVTARTPKKTVFYENLVKLEYQRQCEGYRFDDGSMLEVEIHAYFSIPKSTSQMKRALMMSGKIRPVKRPDIDNICKVILDALNHIAYRDDALITDVSVHKHYCNEPKVKVIIQDVDTEKTVIEEV